MNRYRPDDDDPLDILDIDNRAVRARQVTRLEAVRAARDEEACREALAALTAGARGEANLLALSVEAARRRATVGEISDALEVVFGRHSAQSGTVSGVYAAAFGDDESLAAVRAEAETFARREGRRPRLLVVKLGQDGHDRGARVIASGFADLGFDVDIGPLFQTPEEAVRQAVENDVHAVGVSSQAAGHRTLVPALVAALRSAGAGDVEVVCGGVIPDRDREALRDAGVGAVFGPGTPVPEAALAVLRLIEARREAARGHAA